MISGEDKMKKATATILFFFMLTGFFAVSDSLAGSVKDTESATHGMDASAFSVVDTYVFPGFKLIQFELPVLSIYSYLLISRGEALVVDPVRDIFIYLDTARKEGVRIKGVYLSHSHADFVAGHMELVRAVGATIYQNKKSGAKYPFKPLEEGATLRIGDAKLRFIETPGHTPDGMCGLVFGKENPDTPELMLTGDVLFVGSVGRPDLMEGTTSAAWLASALFDSWTHKISKLGDSVKIFPAHGAGSLCGAHLSNDPYSTLGKEKISNPYLTHVKRGEFIAAMIEGLPEAPRYFKHNAAMNRTGPELVDWHAPMPLELSPEPALTDPAKSYVVDLRDAAAYAEGHIPNSVNIALRGRFENWIGTMVPWDADLVLTGTGNELKEGLSRLHRVGYSARIVTMDTWKQAGLPITVGHPIAPGELHRLMDKGEAPVIVDVRLPEEWMALRIGTILNFPLNHLDRLSGQLDPAEPVVTVCNSAYRSSMAVGILERKGFRMARNLEGGSEAWIKAGLPVYEAKRGGKGETALPKKQVKLPERISASELKRLLMDLPGTFELVDIRPPDHFQDYHIPGSKNVDVGEVISNSGYLVGVGSLIIVDRDGSIAMAVGGILSQKTERPVKVLYGGLETYWTESREMGRPLQPSKPSAVIPPKPATPAKPGGSPAPSTQEPSKSKRKSAGC